MTRQDKNFPLGFARRDFKGDPFRHRFAMTPPPPGEAGPLAEGAVAIGDWGSFTSYLLPFSSYLPFPGISKGDEIPL